MRVRRKMEETNDGEVKYEGEESRGRGRAREKERERGIRGKEDGGEEAEVRLVSE